MVEARNVQLVNAQCRCVIISMIAIIPRRAIVPLTSKILPSPHPRESALPTPGALLPDRGGEK